MKRIANRVFLAALEDTIKATQFEFQFTVQSHYQYGGVVGSTDPLDYYVVEVGQPVMKTTGYVPLSELPPKQKVVRDDDLLIGNAREWAEVVRSDFGPKKRYSAKLTADDRKGEYLAFHNVRKDTVMLLIIPGLSKRISQWHRPIYPKEGSGFEIPTAIFRAKYGYLPDMKIAHFRAIMAALYSECEREALSPDEEMERYYG